jgi:hypothetical protein
MPNNARSSPPGKTGTLPRELWQAVRRAFVEFLAIPTAVIAGFILLAIITYLIDEARMQDDLGAKPPEWSGLFSDAQATREFISVIAGSIITVTSITLSLLLIAVQQGASSLTSNVYDQFLRRRTNQFYFGFFIGLALYSLIVLASINPLHHPTVAVAAAGLLTAAALYALILLVYTTIDEMRTVVILRSIHDHTLSARQAQLDLLRRTRREPRSRHAAKTRIAADHMSPPSLNPPQRLAARSRFSFRSATTWRSAMPSQRSRLRPAGTHSNSRMLSAQQS